MTPADAVAVTRDALVAEAPRLLRALLAYFNHHLDGPSRRDDAHDLAQESVLAAWSQIGAGGRSDVRCLEAFAVAIARNKLAEFRRGRRRRPTTPLADVAERDLAHSLGEWAVDARLAEEERIRMIDRLLPRLPDIERRVLVLRYVENLSNGETARRLAIDADEASRVKYRAEERLRMLAAEEGKKVKS